MKSEAGYERINKIDKPLVSIIKKKTERTQINKTNNKRGEITTNTKEIEVILENTLWATICQQIRQSGRNGCISGKLQTINLEQEEIGNLSRPITSEEIEVVIKNFPRHKSPGQMASQGNSLKILI